MENKMTDERNPPAYDECSFADGDETTSCDECGAEGQDDCLCETDQNALLEYTK
jgi:hypothetical protein